MPFFINDVPIECINRAAVVYQVPATTIISVLKTEGGKVGLASKNKDGTFDYGPMQINSRWLEDIKPYGYTAKDIQYNPCINVEVGTWILRQGLIGDANYWRGVGNYHSHTQLLNERYKNKVHDFYNWLVTVLKK